MDRQTRKLSQRARTRDVVRVKRGQSRMENSTELAQSVEGSVMHMQKQQKLIRLQDLVAFAKKMAQVPVSVRTSNNTSTEEH